MVNGMMGIVVGMVMNILFYNLFEVVVVIDLLMDNFDVMINELMEVLFGLDFLIGGLVMGKLGIWRVYEIGKGFIIVCVKVEIIEMLNGKEWIFVMELFYMVNKVKLIEWIFELYRDKCIEGIMDLWDEFFCEGMWIVIDICCDVSVLVILNNLYKLIFL